jgi:hypothetical protein
MQNKCIRLVIEYISRINLFRGINAYIIYCKLSQIRANLTGADPVVALFHGRRE